MSTLDKLKVTNRLAILCVLLVAGLVVAYALEIAGFIHADLDACLGVELGEGREKCRGETHLAIMNLDTVKTLTVYIFAFTCHQNIFGKVTNAPRCVASASLCSCIGCPSSDFSSNVVRCAVIDVPRCVEQLCATSLRTFQSRDAIQSYVRRRLRL